MNRITSLGLYKEIINQAKKNGTIYSNCFFLANELQKKIDSGNLYYKTFKDGVFLIEDSDRIYRCYYYLKENIERISLRFEKDAVIEIPFAGEMNVKQKKQVEIIESLGFRLGRESGMMSAKTSDIKIFDDIDSEVYCRVATSSDADQIFKLINDTFNPLYSFLPDYSELVTDITEGKIFVIVKDNKVCGALLSEKEKNCASIKQVVIESSYRGKGYGNKLLNYYHKWYYGNTNVFQHWVDLKNNAAVSMYIKNGYDFSIRKANEYIIKKEAEIL